MDGDVESKIRHLMDFIENDAIKSRKFTYDNSRSVLCVFEMLVRAGRMLDTPGGLVDVRELALEIKDVVPDRLTPAKLGFAIERDEKALRDWLVFIARNAVVWMDDQFYHTYVALHVARFGRESGMVCDTAIF